MSNKVFLKSINITEMHSGEINKLHRKNVFHLQLHLSQNPTYSQIPAHSNKLQWSCNADRYSQEERGTNQRLSHITGWKKKTPKTHDKIFLSLPDYLNWLEHGATNTKVKGSIPVRTIH